jgi:alpha-tubulin suppressor-like RCC1 family protein
LHTRARASLRSARGAFDLPAIIAGVVVVGILAAGVLAAVFGVIPWAQTNGAKQDLSAVRTAEGVAKTKDGKFLGLSGLDSAGYLSAKPATLAAGTDTNGTCYVAVAKAPSNVFYATDAKPDPQELKADTVTGCLTAEELQNLLDSIGGLSTSPDGAMPSAAADPKPALAAWGANNYGQLGTGNLTGQNLPTDVMFGAPPAKVHDVSASSAGSFTCAAADDAAYCWGENGAGQLGNGLKTSSNVPVTVQGFTGMKVSSVSAGLGFACAIADGTGYCWGSDMYGKLGNDIAVADSLTPVKIGGALLDKPVTKISTGNGHACAVSNDKAFCWGNRAGGRTGSALSGDEPTPLLVAGFGTKKVTDISVGANQSCAVADGQLYCWGNNGYGQLGNGSTTSTPTPTVVGGPMAGKTVTGVSAGGAVDAGLTHTCAIADGAAYCWGSDNQGRLGDGIGDDKAPNITVPNPAAVVNLTGKTVTGISAGSAFTCLVADGTGYCFGAGGTGNLGDGVPSWSNTPVAVSGKGPMITISAGNNHTAAIYDTANPAVALPIAPLPTLQAARAGSLSASGKDDVGQFGNGTGTQLNTPAAVIGLSNITKASYGDSHSCAITGGQAYCWGSNTYGQLGINSTATVKTPTAVQGLVGTVTDISAGYRHTCAVADGKAYCWGDDAKGQLGNGAGFIGSTVAAPVVNTAPQMAGKTVTSISAGGAHSCAIANWRVYCWGDSANGRLGTTTGSNQNPAAVLSDLARIDVTKVSAGAASTCAVAAGVGYCWGYAGNGILGSGSTTDDVTPRAIGGLLAGNNVTDISIGNQATCAVASDEAYCWGRDGYGVVGNGNVDGATDVNTTGTAVIPVYSVPVKVDHSGVLAGKKVTGIAVSSNFSGTMTACAIAEGGGYCWGSGYYGNLGTGNVLNADVPKAVTGLDGKTVTAVSPGRTVNGFISH